MFHGAYMECGIPYTLVKEPAIAGAIGLLLGNSVNMDSMPGREGVNEDLRFWVTAFEIDEGAYAVNANCLMCHGGKFDGETIMSLSSANADFTAGLGGDANLEGLITEWL